MMDKTASEAYFQGAHEALESMNVPHHIKVAAAGYLTKQAGINPAAKRLLLGGLGVGTLGAGGYLATRGDGEQEIMGPPAPVGYSDVLAGPPMLADSDRSLRERIENAGIEGLASARQGMSDLGDYAADLKARAMSGDLTTAEMAALGIGGAGLLGGAAYGASKLM